MKPIDVASIRIAPDVPRGVRVPLICLDSVPSIEPHLARRRANARDFAAQFALAAILFEREIYFTALYGPNGRYRGHMPAAHAAAWQPFAATAEGREALRRRWDSATAGEAQPLDLFGLKSEALLGLERTLRRRKSHLVGTLLAASFAADLERHEQALALADAALRVSPSDRAALSIAFDAVTRLSVIQHAARERLRSIEARARRAFGADWIHGLRLEKNAQVLQVRRVAWRVRASAEGERFTRFLKTERQFYEEERERAMSAIQPDLVPETLRDLLPLARRFGVSHAGCRAHFVARTPTSQRKAILRVSIRRLDAIYAWVSCFDPATLSPEVAAFSWLLEAIEDMRE